MATDMLARACQETRIGNNTTLCLHVDSREQAERLFGARSEGGSEGSPMADTPWGLLGRRPGPPQHPLDDQPTARHRDRSAADWGVSQTDSSSSCLVECGRCRAWHTASPAGRCQTCPDTFWPTGSKVMSIGEGAQAGRVRELHAQGLSPKQIARTLGWRPSQVLAVINRCSL